MAAFAIFEQTNFTVFLTENMRQRGDQSFTSVLERMHWGVNTQADLDLLNTRSMDNSTFDLAAHFQQYQDVELEDYFSPMAISTNKDRCAYNRATMYAFANKRSEPVYEVLATSTSRNKALIYRLQNKDDDATAKVPFLFSFHTRSMPVMITKRIKKLDCLRCIANGTLGFIVGYIMNGQRFPSPLAVHDDTNFNIHLTEDGVTVKRFKTAPQFILLKIRDCKRILVDGYPPGIVAIPLDGYKTKFKLPQAKKKIRMTVTTFPIIPAYALTPEKLQGVTLNHELFVSTLPKRSPQILYVVFSRVRSLAKLVLSESLTPSYMRKFLPPLHVLTLMKTLIENIDIPNYISQDDSDMFTAWKYYQLLYANEAIALHDRNK
jgi:hypothetical protein